MDAPPEVQQALALRPHDRSEEQRSHIDSWCLESAPGLLPSEPPLPEDGQEPPAEGELGGIAAAPELQDQALQWSVQQCQDKYFLDAYKPVNKDYAKQVYAHRKQLNDCLTELGIPAAIAPTEDEFVDQFLTSANRRRDVRVWNPHDLLGMETPADKVDAAIRTCDVEQPAQ